MIITARQVDVYAYGAPCDMRKQFDTLAALVKKELGRNPLTGSLYLFVSRNRKRAKVLYFDGTGICLFAKRLEKGRFAAVYDRTRGREVKMRRTVEVEPASPPGAAGEPAWPPVPWEAPASRTPGLGRTTGGRARTAGDG